MENHHTGVQNKMPGNTGLHSILDDINERAHQIQVRVAEAAKEMIPEIKNEIFREFGAYQQDQVGKMFRESIDEFYAAYSPAYYNRTYSLYDAIQYEPDEYGIIDDQIDSDSLFSSEYVTPFERGGGSQGLFDLVFMAGWHGGATGTDKRGKSRDVPTYRKPYGRYTMWGRTAVRSTSPQELAMKKIRAAEGIMDNEFRRIGDRYTEILTERLSKRATEIANDVFSDWR